MHHLTESEFLRLARLRSTTRLPREFQVDQFTLNREVAAARAEAMREIFRAIGRFVARRVREFAEWRRYRMAVAELSGLDSRALADIGISRADIPRVAAGLWMPENRFVEAEVKPAPAGNENARQIAA